MVRTNSTMLALATVAPDFALPDTVSGRTVRRADFSGQPLLVVFLCNHCPYVKHIREQLAVVTRDYLGKGVAIVGISSNDAVAYPDDGPAAMRAEAGAAGYAFQYCHDADQRVAQAYRAACTPDFFLFDRAHRLVYRGRFDGSRPKTEQPVAVTGADLAAAMDAVLAGGAPAADQKPSLGCNIKWTPGNEPEWFPA